MRRVLLLLVLLLGGVPAFAQTPDTAGLVVGRLPAGGLLLQKGWRYHPGDNPAWAKPDFDDSGWDSLTVARDGWPLPPQASAGWFRLRLRLGDSLRSEALGLQMQQALAGFEVYSNGKRLGSYGTFSADPARVQAGGTELSALGLRPTPQGELLLAVRYAPWQPAPWLRQYLATGTARTFGALLQTQVRIRATENATLESAAIWAAMAGIFLLLSVLHLVFFRYNRAQLANRYFAYYALTLVVSSLGTTYVPTPSLAALVGVYGGCMVLLLLGAWSSLRALHALFAARPGWLFWGLGASIGPVALLMVGGRLRYERMGIYCFLGFMTVLTADQLWLTWRAMRRQQRGAWLIGVGFGAGILVLLGSVFLSKPLNLPLAASNFFTALGFVLPALGISLYLAREFALDSQLLQVQLGEVERLSAQTLAQEQDKQALLAAQNETLEQQVAQRTEELQHSLTNLQTAQTQLIQAEKMASLGELTAGVAHEIQNPLNFVNNFAELSVELLQDRKSVG